MAVSRPEGTAQRTLFDAVVRPVWLLLVVVVVAFSLFEVPLTWQYVPLALSVLLLGLPHGAIDHLVPARLDGQTADLRTMLGVGALYAVVGGAYLLVWFLSPVVAFVFFILMTWAHWGQGDVHALVALFDAEHLDGRLKKATTAIVRGGMPMLVPLVAFPEQYRFVAETLIERFAASAAVLDPVFTADARLALGVGFGTLVVGTLAAGAEDGGWKTDGWRLDVTETGLLAVFFATVPPVFAIGLYFCFWHALRHVSRLVLLDPTSVRSLEAGRLRPAILRFGRDAAPLTLASILILAAFYLVVPVQPGNVAESVGLYLVLIAVLTLPHVLVVALMDRKQGIWS
ncbi:MAG: Brp/Blh family beta-carotene 15,15'-dioxygenase [Natronomonas sp.]